jgi:hypothetical protein
MVPAIAVLAALASATGAFADSGSGGAPGPDNLFITSAVEHPDGTVTLPLHRGVSHGQTVYYVITDVSDGNLAAKLGVNKSAKLANAASVPGAVEKVSIVNGVVNFPATVDFSPVRQLTPGPTGFPPASAQPGAIGQPGYSPLIELPNGTVESAPQIARDQNGDGVISLGSETADKVVSINPAAGTVTYRERAGFQGGKPVLYASFDSSNAVAAAIEDVTYAPSLDLAPTIGDDSTASSRASLAAFVNGQTGATNPQRQGLNSALLDGLSPLNVLRNPTQGRYSPLWDVHLAQWTAAAITAGQNLRQTDFGTVQNLAASGLLTGPRGGALRSLRVHRQLPDRQHGALSSRDRRCRAARIGGPYVRAHRATRGHRRGARARS